MTNGCQEGLVVLRVLRLNQNSLIYKASGVYSLYVVACVLALLVYFYLMFRQFSRHRPQEPYSTSPGSSRSARLQTFLSFVDGKVEKSKSSSKRKRESVSSNDFDKEDK